MKQTLFLLLKPKTLLQLSIKKVQSQACAGRVADILRHTLPQDTEERLKEIQGQLKLYEDDIAEELLNQLVNKLEKEDGAND